MSTEDLIRVIEAAVLIAGLAAIIYAVFRSRTTASTIQELQDLVDVQGKTLIELRVQHEENEKKITNMQAQLQVVKDIPLKEIAENLTKITANDTRQTELMESISNNQTTIVDLIQGKQPITAQA